MPINGLQTSSTAVNSNLYVATGTSSSSTTSSAYQTLSSTATNIRVGVRGSTSVTPSVGNSYGSFVIGTEALTIPSSGTSALFAQQIIKPLTITSGAGTLTNSASLYVEGAATNATNNYNTWFGGGSVRIDGRVLGAKGADVTAAGDITLTQGNLIHITGNTQINAITTTGWTAGSVIVLFFTGTPTVKNNTAGGANTAPFLLAGGVDFVATANDVLEVIFNGTNFVEIGRSIN